MGPSEPRRRCDSRLARIPQGVAPSRGTQPHSDGGWPTIDMEGLGRGPWSKTEEKTVNGGRSTGGGGHAGLVAANACDLGPNSAGARGSKMAFSGVGGERAQELAGWRRATPYGERRRPSFDLRNVTGGQGNACTHARGDEGM